MTSRTRVAVVTGGGQGIGYGIANGLAAEGVSVVVADLNGEQAANAAEAIAQTTGAALTAVAGDVGVKADAQRMIGAALEHFGRIDILVNNAGIGRDRTVKKMSEAEWDDVLRVNLKGPFLCAQAAMTPMTEQRFGRIISIGSRAWLGGFGQANYSASKGGLVSLTRTLALEGARAGVTANCVIPALVGTPLFQQLGEERRAELAATVPMGRVGSVEDIAWAVRSLAADEAGYITGQYIHVCGGRSLGSAT
jgi:NAD(P)-dependent dehydrogenase (short-subunit alcohol dehydrogenase family)